MKLDRFIKIYAKANKNSKNIVTRIEPKEQPNFWLDLDKNSPIISLRKEVANASN
jgi:predicted nucleic acid-binding protein